MLCRPGQRRSCFSIGGALSLVAIARLVGAAMFARRKRIAHAGIVNFIENDSSPSMLATEQGTIRAQNRAATMMFVDQGAQTISAMLAGLFANASAIVFRLQTRAAQAGAAQEDILTRDGHVRLAVHRVDATFLWRVETLQQHPSARSHTPEQNLPMLMVGRTDSILFMNDAARAVIGSRVKALDRIFRKLPIAHGMLAEVATADGPEIMLVADLPAGAGRRAVYLLPGHAEHATDIGWQAFQKLPIPLIKIAPNGSILSFNTMASSLVGPGLTPQSQLSDLMEGLGRAIGDWLAETLEGRLKRKSEFLRLKRDDR